MCRGAVGPFIASLVCDNISDLGVLWLPQAAKSCNNTGQLRLNTKCSLFFKMKKHVCLQSYCYSILQRQAHHHPVFDLLMSY